MRCERCRRKLGSFWCVLRHPDGMQRFLRGLRSDLSTPHNVLDPDHGWSRERLGALVGNIKAKIDEVLE